MLCNSGHSHIAPHCPRPQYRSRTGWRESNPGAQTGHLLHTSFKSQQVHARTIQELAPALLQASEASTGVALHHMWATFGTKAKNRHHDESRLRINGHTALWGRTLSQGSTTSCHLPALRRAPRRPQTAFTQEPCLSTCTARRGVPARTRRSSSSRPA